MPVDALIREGARLHRDIESDAIRGVVSPDIVSEATDGTYQAKATSVVVDTGTTNATVDIRLKPAARIGDRRLVSVTPGAAVDLSVFPPVGESFANGASSFEKTTTNPVARTYVFRYVRDGVWSVPTE